MILGLLISRIRGTARNHNMAAAEDANEVARNHNTAMAAFKGPNVEGMKILILEVKSLGNSLDGNAIATMFDQAARNNNTIRPIVVQEDDAARNQVVEVCVKTETNPTDEHKQLMAVHPLINSNIAITGSDYVYEHNNGSCANIEVTSENPNIDIVENEIFLSVVDGEVCNNNNGVGIAVLDDTPGNPNAESKDTARNLHGNSVGQNGTLFSFTGENKTKCSQKKTSIPNKKQVSSDIGSIATSLDRTVSRTQIEKESENNLELSNEKAKSLLRRGKRLARCSGYNVFFQEYLTSNPGKSFGNIAKDASTLWKTLTSEQKQNYGMHAEKLTQQLETQLHTGDQKYVCPKCGRRISHHKNFANHIKECGQKFPCPSCDSVFMEKRNLTKHISAVHQKVKTYMCKKCQKGFAYRKDLMRHMVQHSGESPFQCPGCSMKFSWKCNLRRHQTKAQHFKEATTSEREGGGNETKTVDNDIKDDDGKRKLYPDPDVGGTKSGVQQDVAVPE